MLCEDATGRPGRGARSFHSLITLPKGNRQRAPRSFQNAALWALVHSIRFHLAYTGLADVRGSAHADRRSGVVDFLGKPLGGLKLDALARQTFLAPVRVLIGFGFLRGHGKLRS